MNVVAILLDTLRRDHLGCYGNQWIHTPNLDRFAERSTVFDHAYIGSYPCMPARQDLWTGRLNFLWRGWSPLEWAEADLVGLLHEAGKPSMLITDHYHLWNLGSGNYHTSFSGTEFIRGQEMDNWITDATASIKWPAPADKLNPLWERYARNTSRRTREEDYFAPQVFARATRWIEENQTQKDFFLLIDAFDPHEPFDPPKAYVDLYDPGFAGDALVWPRYGPPTRHGYTAREVEHCHALYCGEISLIDRWFGQFLDRLETTGLLSNTVIILTSDHGFLFGEYDWLGKHSPTLHPPIVRTPLIVYHPDRSESCGRSQRLAQMHDLFPTILEAIGLPVPRGIHGRSLLPALASVEEKTNPVPALFGVFGGAVYATDGHWMFVKRPIPENSPLHWYTDAHFNSWGFGQVNDVAQSRTRLASFADGRFPVWYADDVLRHGGPGALAPPTASAHLASDSPRADELYRVADEEGSTESLTGRYPEIADRFRLAIADELRRLDAPPEHLVRLGLESVDGR